MKVASSLSSVHSNSFSYKLKMTHHITEDWENRKGEAGQVRVSKRGFWELLTVQRCFPLMFKLRFWVYFTNNGSLEHPGWKCWWIRRKHPAGLFPVKSLMSGLSGVSSPTSGRSWSFHEGDVERASSQGGGLEDCAKIRLRLMGNFCSKKLEVIMGSLLLRQTFTQVPGCHHLSAPSWSSQPAFPGHINRWFSEAGWRRKTAW